MQEILERKSIKNIDFNCDLAQSYGIYKNNTEFDKILEQWKQSKERPPKGQHTERSASTTEWRVCATITAAVTVGRTSHTVARPRKSALE